MTSKFGFYQTKQKIFLNCQFANSNNIFCEKMFLNKGNVKQVKIKAPRFTIGEPGSCGYPLPPKELPFKFIKTISGGVVNGKALSLVKPEYPQSAIASNVKGVVNVLVLIDIDGNVLSAKAISGPQELQETAIQAAIKSKFSPIVMNGESVKVSGMIVYNIVPPVK